MEIIKKATIPQKRLMSRSRMNLQIKIIMETSRDGRRLSKSNRFQREIITRGKAARTPLRSPKKREVKRQAVKEKKFKMNQKMIQGW